VSIQFPLRKLPLATHLGRPSHTRRACCRTEASWPQLTGNPTLIPPGSKAFWTLHSNAFTFNCPRTIAQLVPVLSPETLQLSGTPPGLLHLLRDGDVLERQPKVKSRQRFLARAEYRARRRHRAARGRNTLSPQSPIPHESSPLLLPLAWIVRTLICPPLDLGLAEADFAEPRKHSAYSLPYRG